LELLKEIQGSEALFESEREWWVGEEKNVGTGSRQQAAMFEQRMWVDSKRHCATSLTHL